MNPRHHPGDSAIKKAGPPLRRARTYRFAENSGHNLTRCGRRFPPFAKRHADRLRNPQTTAWVAVGKGAWQWAKDRPSHVVIVCPPGDDPLCFDWTPCAGHDPVLLVRTRATDGEQVRALVQALMRDGTERVLTEDGTRYVREVTDGAA